MTKVIKTLNVHRLKKDSTKGFKILENVNRSVAPAHVTKMAESIMKIGVVRPVVVSHLAFKGIKDHYIVDGQHLYHALIRLGCDIPYVIVDINDDEELVETLALLNNSSRSWTLQDYVQSWSFVKNEYKTLIKYFNIYDLELSTIAGILHGKAESIQNVIKKGKFQIKSEEKAIELMAYTTDLLKIIPRQDRTANKKLVNTYIAFVYDNYSTYNHKKFINYLKRNIKKLGLINPSSDDLISFYSEGI